MTKIYEIDKDLDEFVSSFLDINLWTDEDWDELQYETKIIERSQDWHDQGKFAPDDIEF